MRLILVAALFLTSGFASAGDMSSVMVRDVRAAASIGAAKAGAGYMVLMNQGAAEVVLTEVVADFPRVELHNIEEIDGQTTMVRQDNGISIPAGEMVVLAPGGFHVMFMGLSAPFVAGESFDATLVFDGVDPVEVVFEVVAREDLKPTGHDGHGQSGNGDHGGSN